MYGALLPRGENWGLADQSRTESQRGGVAHMPGLQRNPISNKGSYIERKNILEHCNLLGLYVITATFSNLVIGSSRV